MAKNKNSNTTQCDCISNDDEKSLTFSEYKNNECNNNEVECSKLGCNKVEGNNESECIASECISDEIKCCCHSDENIDVDVDVDNEDAIECNCDEEECVCYEYEDEDEEDDDSGKRTLIYYNEDDDMYNEELNYNYHIRKHFGNWQYAKMIISHSYNDKQATEFFWDYLNLQFQENNDNFDNIKKVYYKNDLDIGIIYEFDSEIAKYLVDNIKIQSYKPKGYIFNGAENQNKWEFKIVVITSKGIYTANRYINENTIGFY